MYAYMQSTADLASSLECPTRVPGISPVFDVAVNAEALGI